MSSAEQSKPSRKRKRKLDTISESRKRQNKNLPDYHLRAHYNPDQIENYIQELNEEIDDTVHGVRYYNPLQDEKIKGSLIGATYWSRREKLKFFNALAVYPQNDLDRIAPAVGKSIVEVQAYLLLLQDATTELKLTVGAKNASLDMRKVPPAVEVAPEVEFRLSMAAEMLEDQRLQIEEDLDFAKHGENWILDKNIAEKYQTAYEEYLKNPENTKADILKELPFAELLKLHKLLYFSKKFFVSHRENCISEDSLKYRHKYFAGTSEPSIRLTAFNDFHSIVVNLTRKLVSASLFQANTRIRAFSQRQQWVAMGAIVHEKVREKDVITALDILGLKRNSQEYWKTIARRLNLICVNKPIQPSRKDQLKDLHDVHLNLPENAVLNYDQVELALSAKSWLRGKEPPKDIEEDWSQISAKIWDIENQKVNSHLSDDGISQNSDSLQPKANEHDDEEIEDMEIEESQTESDIMSESSDPLDVDLNAEAAETEELEQYDKAVAERENERLLGLIGKMSKPFFVYGDMMQKAIKNGFKPAIVRETDPNAEYEAMNLSSDEQTSEDDDEEDTEDDLNGNRSFTFKNESQSSQWRDKTDYEDVWERNLPYS